MRAHLVLIGLPGAGKSLVGGLAARALGQPFRDLDDCVEAAAGCSVTELFAGDGEPAFRLLEQARMTELLAGPATVIAAGGGWAAQPGNLAAAKGMARTVYLRVSAEIAARRIAGTSHRPLLAGGNSLEALVALLHAREQWYLRADAIVDADAAPEEVAAQVIHVAMRPPGQPSNVT